MPWYLKATGNCNHCKEEVPLRSLKEADWVKCAHCRELFRLMSLVHHREREALERYTAAPKAEGARQAVLYLRAASLRLEAAALVVEAYEHGMRGMAPAVQRRWLDWATSRSVWASQLSALVEPLLKQQRASASHGLHVLKGGLSGEELPSAPSSHGQVQVLLLGQPEDPP